MTAVPTVTASTENVNIVSLQHRQTHTHTHTHPHTHTHTHTHTSTHTHTPTHTTHWRHLVYSESGLGVAPGHQHMISEGKRDFGGSPLLTEWFTHLPTKVGLSSVCWPLWREVVDTEIGVKQSRYLHIHTTVQ